VVQRIVTTAGVLVLALLGACSGGNAYYQRLDTGVVLGGPREGLAEFYDINAPLPRPIIPVASISAAGNAYSSFDYLKQLMARKGAEIGADVVICHKAETINAGYTTNYYSGWSIASTTPVNGPVVHGTAGVWSNVRLGVNFDDRSEINDVTPASGAWKAGIRIGDRVLAVEGVRITQDRFALYKAIANKHPGDTLSVEILPRSGDQRTVTIVLDPPGGPSSPPVATTGTPVTPSAIDSRR
jgi:hypothetical protein